MDINRIIVRHATALMLVGALLLPLTPAAMVAQQTDAQPQSDEPLYRFRVNSDLVLVSVTARDKSGNLVRDLKQSDFTVFEDKKQQTISSFDVQDVTVLTDAGPSQQVVSGAPIAPILTSQDKIAPNTLRDHRLIVLFFDMGSMQPDEVSRALTSAQKFVSQQMNAADLVSIVSLASSLRVDQDFTADRNLLTSTLRKLNGDEGEGMENGGTGETEGTEDTGQAFSADDTEYNIFNTDRKLQALAAVADNLSRLDQKKSILYFGGGIEKTGIENQSQMRATINTAVRSNVSIYPVDSRGLQAIIPGGDARTASLRGTSAYSGRAVQSEMDSNFASQETLFSLAADTGGKAFLDTNDFSKAFERVQADSSLYYVIGYRSSNTSMDGHFRRISVKVNRPDIKLEFRSGYYGPRDWQHFTREDKEKQLQDELASDLPNTDLPVYVASEYFRAQEDRYFIPVSIVVPGSALAQNGDQSKASLDIMGLLREAKSQFPVGNIRETIKLTGDALSAPATSASASGPTPVSASTQTRRKNVQYNTGFLLPPGTYHLKFVVRENQNGRLGSFETDLKVPDIKKNPLKMSTVVMANQRTPAPKKKSQNPLVRDGQQLIPNVAHVFNNDQQLYFYYEVYDPVRKKTQENKNGVHLLTSIQFFKGKVKAYETPMVEALDLNRPERSAAAFQFEVPLGQLKPGWYTCQVNVVDDSGGTFAFPRLPMLIRAVP